MKLKLNSRIANFPNYLSGFRYDLFAAITIVVLCVLNSCGKETVEIASPSFDYFQTARGKYVIYDVDSIVHATNDNDNDDSVYYYHYQVKEVIDTPFTDGEGKTRQVVVRYYRADSTQEWSINIVWSQLLTSAGAYRWEDNIPYHKMSYPISYQIEWNGNDKNTLQEEMYHYDAIHDPGTYNDLSFDSTLTIIQRDDDNFVEKIFGKEVYAAGIGMIYRERNELRKTSGNIVSGTEFRMVVNAFGE